MTSPDMDRILGDYRLKCLKLETPTVIKWEAEQISVGRKVLVDELKPDASEQNEKFIADVRAKAAIEHPLIASVYEAVDSSDCYFAYEYLPGASLENRVEAGEPMDPLELTMLLRRIAEIHVMLEKRNKSTAPMNLEHLYVDTTGVLRVANLVVDGFRDHGESGRDMTYLGRALLPLVADGKEGTTRMLTLLTWMRGEGDEDAMSWQQVIELCERIERQLTGEPTLQMMEAPVAAPAPAKARPTGLVVATGLLGFAVVFLLVKNLTGDRGDTSRVELPPPIDIPETPAGDGRPMIPAFRIMAHEVTIGQYAEFLDTLDALEQAGSKPDVFDHEDQPEEKVSHEPDDWENLLATARRAGLWNKQRITLDTPVVGVDWWDAHAYSSWKRGSLPSELEWLAALGKSRDQIGDIIASSWGRIDLETADRTSNGVLNMAGSVSEWTRLQTPDPVNPLGAKKWLVLGGSYKLSDSHALTPTRPDDRGLRRDDLGFRVIFDAE